MNEYIIVMVINMDDLFNSIIYKKMVALLSDTKSHLTIQQIQSFAYVLSYILIHEFDGMSKREIDDIKSALQLEHMN
jgi:hypothetical protein